MVSKTAPNYLNALSKVSHKIPFCQCMDENSPSWNFSLHSHDYLEIICFLDGALTINQGAKQIQAAACSVVVHPPHILHQEFPQSGVHRKVITFWLDNTVSDYPAASFQVIDKTGEISALCKHIYREYCGRDGYSDKLLQLYLSTFFLLMARLLPLASSEDILHSVTEYLQENYHSPVTLEQLTALAAVSPSYLERLFRKHLQTSPLHYLQSLRIQEAKKLLLYSSFSVDEIAGMVGFPDSSYFWRVFRRNTGFSPSEYRRKSQIPRCKQRGI